MSTATSPRDRLLLWAAAAVLVVNVSALAFQFGRLRKVVAAARKERVDADKCLQGRWVAEATKRYGKALSLLELTLGETNTEVASCLEDLGWAQAELGDLGHATRSYERAVRIREAIAPEDRALVSPLTRLGALHRDRGDLQASQRILLRALDQCEQARLSARTSRREPLVELSRTYQRQGRLSDALQAAQRAVDASPTTTGWAVDNATTTFPQLGEVEWELKHLDTAHQIFRYCLHLAKSAQSPNHDTIGLTSLQLLDIRIAAGELDKARGTLKALQALTKIRSLGPRDADLCLLDATLAYHEGKASAHHQMVHAIEQVNGLLNNYPRWVVGTRQRRDLFARAAGALQVGSARFLLERELTARSWRKYRECPQERINAKRSLDIYQMAYDRARQGKF